MRLCVIAFLIYATSGRVSVVGLYLVLAACSLLVCLVQGKRLACGNSHCLAAMSGDAIVVEHWRYGSWTLLTVPMSIVCYQGYFLISGAVLSVEEAGYLKAADALIAPFSQIAIGVSLMFVPIAARRLDAMAADAKLRYAGRLCTATLGLAAVYAAAVFLFGNTLIHLIFGRHLAAAGEVVQIVALVPLFVGAGVPAGIMLAANRRSDLRFAAYVFATAASVCVGFPLVNWAGIDGAAWGLVLSQASLAAGLWAVLLWRSKAPAPANTHPASEG